MTEAGMDLEAMKALEKAISEPGQILTHVPIMPAELAQKVGLAGCEKCGFFATPEQLEAFARACRNIELPAPRKRWPSILAMLGCAAVAGLLTAAVVFGTHAALASRRAAAARAELHIPAEALAPAPMATNAPPELRPVTLIEKQREEQPEPPQPPQKSKTKGDRAKAKARPIPQRRVRVEPMEP